MGAALQTVDVEPGDAAKVRAAFRDACEHARAKYGSNSYSGQLNNHGGSVIIMAEKIFPSRHAAEDWIGDNAEKRGPAIAVHYIPANQTTPHAKTITESQQALLARENELRALPAAMIARAREAKSKTRGCSACGSAIAVAFIGKLQKPGLFGPPTSNCPICDDRW